MHADLDTFEFAKRMLAPAPWAFLEKVIPLEHWSRGKVALRVPAHNSLMNINDSIGASSHNRVPMGRLRRCAISRCARAQDRRRRLCEEIPGGEYVVPFPAKAV